MLFNRAGQLYMNTSQAQLLYYLMFPYWQAMSAQINMENEAQRQRMNGKESES